MKSINYIIIILILFSGCNKKPEINPKPFPFTITNPVTEITADGATFSAEVLNRGEQEITAFGFILEGNNQTYTFNLNDITSLNVFKYRCNVDIVADKKYKVRAYVKTVSDSVISNKVSFIGKGSLPPEILSFSPTSGPDNSEVLLLCKNINLQPDKNKVYLNNESCEVMAVRGDTIVCKTPSTSYVGEAVFKVSNGLYNDSCSSKFTITGLVATSFTPLTGKCSERITLKVDNFLLDGDDVVEVYFNNDFTWFGSATVLNVTNNTIDIIAPPYGLTEDKSCTITVKIGLKEATFNQEFLMYKSWDEKKPGPFKSRETYPAVVYNGCAYVLDTWIDKSLYRYTPVEDAWEPVVSSEFPEEMLFSSLYVVVGDILYKVGGREHYGDMQNTLWTYDFISGNWEQKSDLPFRVMSGKSFELNGYIYVITSSSEVWKCDFENEQYIKLNDFPGNKVVFSFKSNATTYVATTSKTYRYNKQNDLWSEVCDAPPSYSYYGLDYNNTGYTYCSNSIIYKFDNINYKWSSKSYYPGTRSGYKILFSMNNQMYLFDTGNDKNRVLKAFAYFE